MPEEFRNEYTEKMTRQLPVLRRALGLSQTELAEILDLSRSAIANVENGRQKMTWNMFLSLLLIFSRNAETERLLGVMEISTDELNELIMQR